MEIIDKKELIKAFENDCAGECAICSHVYGFDDCGMVKDFPTIKAIPLDKVKQARGEIENLTPWDECLVGMYEVLEILDKLIESEGTND